jgi:diguanylate cyclase (GGDEF)-like protein
MPMIRLLVIDDDVLDRKAVARALKGLGNDYEMYEAQDGESGLVLALEQTYDCILIDYNLPDMNGLQLLDQLRTQRVQAAPIVMLTGVGNEFVAVEAMKRGAYDYLPKAELGPDTLYRVVTNAIEKSLLQRKLAEAQEKLEHLALFDQLTGLGNRNLFHLELPRAVMVAERKKNSFALLLLDLNRFKVINDSFGHAAGDAILAAVGSRLRAMTRAADSCFRFGGDEFTAILDADSDAKVVARRIVTVIAEPIMFGDRVLNVGVSIGMATYPADADNAQDLLRAADAAMYQVKNAGRPQTPGPTAAGIFDAS